MGGEETVVWFNFNSKGVDAVSLERRSNLWKFRGRAEGFLLSI